MFAFIAGLSWVTPLGWAAERVVSLDYCADQFTLGLLPKSSIAALSIDAERDFSYMRKQAIGIKKVRASAENILALEPTMIVRSYGGGPNAKAFYERLGIPVVQIGYSGSIQQVKTELRRLGRELGQADRGRELAEDMDHRLEALQAPAVQRSVMYITQGGVTSGRKTLVDEMISAAKLTNFETRPGWRDIPLEELTLAKPELIAAAFYQSGIQHQTFWSAARHPIIRGELDRSRPITLDGATTACGGWFLMDAVESLHQAAYP